MAYDAHKNFAYSTVATAPSPASSGTSLVVAAAEGANFPAAPFNATIWPVSTLPLPSNAEIVRVTNIATDTFTITRTQEGTSARTVVVGDQIAATITAKLLTDIENSANYWTVVTKPSDQSVASNATPAVDSDLVFTAVNGAFYEVELYLIYGSPAGGGTPDMKVSLGEDNTLRGVFSLLGENAGDTVQNIAGSAARNIAAGAFGTATTDRAAIIKGHYWGAGGTFALLWSQNTSGVNATILRAGSEMRYRRVL